MEFMAARCGMLRQAETVGAIKLTKVHTTANLAGIFTKPRGKEDSCRLRAMVMGLEAWSVLTSPSAVAVEPVP